MKKINFTTSTCRLCRYYQPEGHRGGTCQKLNAPVQGNWKACLLAASPFTTNPWENWSEIIRLEKSFSLNCSEEHSALVTTQSQPSEVKTTTQTATKA